MYNYTFFKNIYCIPFSEDLHGLLQGCVNSFRHISLVSKGLKGASVQDNSDFLSVDTVNGKYYCIMMRGEICLI